MYTASCTDDTYPYIRTSSFFILYRGIILFNGSIGLTCLVSSSLVHNHLHVYFINLYVLASQVNQGSLVLSSYNSLAAGELFLLD